MKAEKKIIFDLDDTLSKEILYLKSAYYEIATHVANSLHLDVNTIHNQMIEWYQAKENVFQKLDKFYALTKNHITISDLLVLYRNHRPKITLNEEVHQVLKHCQKQGFNLGLLTDGRSVQQRSKISALDLETYFEEIIISEEFGSEKPNKNNYQHFEATFGKGLYYYIGDNTKKDFISPNQLGWTSVCLLDNGTNIHPQNFELPKIQLPKYTIKRISELIPLL